MLEEELFQLNGICYLNGNEEEKELMEKIEELKFRLEMADNAKGEK